MRLHYQDKLKLVLSTSYLLGSDAGSMVRPFTPHDREVLGSNAALWEVEKQL